MQLTDKPAAAAAMEDLYVNYNKKTDDDGVEKRQFLELLWPDLANVSLTAFKRAIRLIITREGDSEEERKKRQYFPTVASILTHCNMVTQQSGQVQPGSWYAANRWSLEHCRPMWYYPDSGYQDYAEEWAKMNHNFCMKLDDRQIEDVNRERARQGIPLLQRTVYGADGQWIPVPNWREYERIQALQNYGTTREIPDLSRKRITDTALTRVSREEGLEESAF